MGHFKWPIFIYTLESDVYRNINKVRFFVENDIK